MLKVLIFARRKQGLDRATFISLYESEHLALTDRLVADGVLPSMADYRRNYLVKDDPANIGSTPDFDVVTEAWFKDKADFAANREGASRPEIAEQIGADMCAFLDLATLSYVMVEEYCGTPAMRAAQPSPPPLCVSTTK